MVICLNKRKHKAGEVSDYEKITDMYWHSSYAGPWSCKLGGSGIYGASICCAERLFRVMHYYYLGSETVEKDIVFICNV